MPTSATGNSRAAERGFTLVELMVVLVIVGLAAGAVVLAMPDPRGDMRSDAERFAARARAAQDAAIIDARDVALVVGRDGYRFERRVDRHWQPIAERPFAPEAWSRDTVAIVAGGAGRTIFDTTGSADPLALALVRDGARIDVRIDADGTIDVAR